MRKILVSVVTVALAACGSSAAPPAKSPAAAVSTSVLELGEITVFDGAQAMLKLHADGTTEMGVHSGKMEITPGQTASSDSLPVTWKPGPTIKADGTFELKGEAVLKVSADGKVIDVKKSEPLPLTVTGDSVSIVEGAKTFTIGLGDDGKLTFAGGDAKPDGMPRVEGADTPGKRRTVLVFIGLMLSGEREPQVSPAVSVPAATP